MIDCDGSKLIPVRIHATGQDVSMDCPGCDNCVSYRERHGHCEDAPCCGCCPADENDSGMTKEDYLEIMSRPDYDADFDFGMNG